MKSVHHPLFDAEPDDAEHDRASSAAAGPPRGVTSALLQSAELRDANATDALSALEALFAAGHTPTAADIITALEACALDQREKLAQDNAFIDRVIETCPTEALPAVLQTLFDDPKWMLYHYACRNGGHDKAVIERLIALGSLDERKEIIGWSAVCQRIEAILGDADPDVIFGADLAAALDADPQALAHLAVKAPWYLIWRLRADRLDLPALYARLAESPEALQAGLQPGPRTTPGQPSAWMQLVAHSPRGEALDEASRAHLDHIALHFTSLLSVEQLRQAFELRFDQPLGEDTETGVTIEHDVQDIRDLWEQLTHLPPSHITPQAIRRAAAIDPRFADDDDGPALAERSDDDDDDDTDAIDGIAEDKTQDEQTQDEQTQRRYPHAIRQAIGHDLALTTDAFQRFAAPSPAQWRRYPEAEAIIDEFVTHCGGDPTLRAAALAYLEATTPEATAIWHRAVDAAERRGALTAPAAQVRFALQNLKDAAPVAHEPRAEIGGRKFLHHKDPATGAAGYMSYATAGEDTAALGAGAYASWPAYFAEIYARWHALTPAPDRGKALPAWVDAHGFGALAGEPRKPSR